MMQFNVKRSADLKNKSHNNLLCKRKYTQRNTSGIPKSTNSIKMGGGARGGGGGGGRRGWGGYPCI